MYETLRARATRPYSISTLRSGYGITTMFHQQLSVFQSGIRDNRDRGSVGRFLQDKIKPGARLSIVSAYFTIYAFAALEKELGEIESLDFLFGEPRFLQSFNRERESQVFTINAQGILSFQDGDIPLQQRLNQDKLARDCAQWIREKVSIKSIQQANLLHGKMYYIENCGVRETILGSSNFTTRGLGLANGNNNIELNLVVDSDRDKQDLKTWFNELWDNQKIVEDVKERVLTYLQQLYQDNAPEFIYYKTLYHLFKPFLDQKDKSDLLAQEKHLFDSKIWQLLL
jgi:hypothetical protein